MNEVDNGFIRDLQKFVAVAAVGASVLRGRNRAGEARRIQGRLATLDLATVATLNETAFADWLDRTTADLISDRIEWGAVRKAVNLFLRDCLYNKYLNSHYGLDRIEKWLEIPLDSVVAGALIDDEPSLPRWTGLNHLIEKQSRLYQEHAREMAARRTAAGPKEQLPAEAAVHLDIGLWVNNRSKVKQGADNERQS